jgi:hypothetical protein
MSAPVLTLIQGGRPKDAPRDPKHRARMFAAIALWHALKGAS